MSVSPNDFILPTRRSSDPSRVATWRERFADSDLWRSFTASRTAFPAGCFLVVTLACVLGAPWVAPYDPRDLASISLLDAHTPPAWIKGGTTAFLLGTDEQGRDLLSAILFGARTSLGVGAACVALAGVIGVTLGLMAGYLGRLFDSVAMRAADIQMTIPDVMLALLVTGVLFALLPRGAQTAAAPGFLFWPSACPTGRNTRAWCAHAQWRSAARIMWRRHRSQACAHRESCSVMCC